MGIGTAGQYVANIDTAAHSVDTTTMSDRQTMNVSLPEAQEKFVRAQVASGRYRSASEVLRDGLRMLEEAEHKRLLEKWMSQGLTRDEEAQLPPELLARAKEHLGNLIRQGLDDVRLGRVVDGPEATDQMRKRLEARKVRKSA